MCLNRLPRLDQSDKQQIFARNFGMGNIYDTADRRGIAVDLLILFRDIHPKVGVHTVRMILNQNKSDHQSIIFIYMYLKSKSSSVR